MTNEVNKLIWPSTDGVGHIDEAAWDQTVDMAMNTKNDQDKTIITKAPPSSAYSNKYVDQALDELKADGVDVMGSGFQPITVTLKEGGK
jgi:NitT/TauT family transport system substrate-binding protein